MQPYYLLTILSVMLSSATVIEGFLVKSPPRSSVHHRRRDDTLIKTEWSRLRSTQNPLQEETTKTLTATTTTTTKSYKPNNNKSNSAWWYMVRRALVEPVKVAYLSPSRVFSHFDSATGFASSFLMIQLGADSIMNFSTNPLPCLYAGLCFFHVMVYWVNFHHFMRFQEENFTIGQIWGIAFLSLGLVLYPLALQTWIKYDENLVYYLDNVFLCASLTLTNIQIDTAKGDSLYRLYHKVAPPLGFVYYVVAVLLREGHIMGPSNIMIWIAPFFFMFPLGGPRFEGGDDDGFGTLPNWLQNVMSDDDDDDNDDGDPSSGYLETNKQIERNGANRSSKS